MPPRQIYASAADRRHWRRRRVRRRAGALAAAAGMGALVIGMFVILAALA
jgi:hypothetical protein